MKIGKTGSIASTRVHVTQNFMARFKGQSTVYPTTQAACGAFIPLSDQCVGEGAAEALRNGAVPAGGDVSCEACGELIVKALIDRGLRKHRQRLKKLSKGCR